MNKEQLVRIFHEGIPCPYPAFAVICTVFWAVLLGEESAHRFPALLLSVFIFCGLSVCRWRRKILKPIILLIFLLVFFLAFRREYATQVSAGRVGDAVELELAVLKILGRGVETNYSRALVQSASGARFIASIPAKDVFRSDHITLRAKLRMAEPEANPGSYNELEYARSLGASLVLSNVQLIQSSYGILHWGAARAERFNHFVGERLRQILPTEESFLAHALLFGQRKLLSESVAEDFAEAGLSQILVLSGLHISIITRALQMLQRKFKISWELAFSMRLIVLFIWVLVAGGQTGLWRAFLSGQIRELRKHLGFHGNSLNDIALAAVILLLFDPLRIRQMSFLFSFVSAFGVILMKPLLHEIFSSILRLRNTNLLERTESVLALQFSLLPLLLWQEGSFSLFATFLSFPACLLAEFLLQILLLTWLPFCWLWQFFGSGLTSLSLRPMLVMLRRLAEIGADYAGYRTNSTAPGYFLANLILLALILLLGLIFLRPAYRRKWVRLVSILGLSSILILSVYTSIRISKRAELWFLSVGQGDAAVLLLGRQAILIDGGIPEMGKEVLIPFMKEQGIRRFDLAVFSHLHADHAGGIVELLKKGRIKEIMLPIAEWIPTRRETETAFSEEQILKLCQKQEAVVHWAGKGDNINLDREGRASLLCVLPNPGRIESDANECSLIFILTIRGRSVLFTGDMTPAAETELIREARIEPVNYLKIAHHGSKTVSSDVFLERTKPQLTLISCGRNLYGHPSPEVLKRLDTAFLAWTRTDYDGALRIRFDRHEDFGLSWKTKKVYRWEH